MWDGCITGPIILSAVSQHVPRQCPARRVHNGYPGRETKHHIATKRKLALHSFSRRDPLALARSYIQMRNEAWRGHKRDAARRCRTCSIHEARPEKINTERLVSTRACTMLRSCWRKLKQQKNAKMTFLKLWERHFSVDCRKLDYWRDCFCSWAKKELGSWQILEYEKTNKIIMKW